MSMLDSGSEEPRSKLRRWVITGVVLAALIALGLWYIFRFYPEKKTVERFLNAVVAGDMQKARDIWKPSPSYLYEDFLADWGPNGYYGPVKSYRIVTAESPGHGGSGVIVVVGLSPYPSFPDDKDAAKNRRTKEVRLWVERKDKSIGFPP